MEINSAFRLRQCYGGQVAGIGYLNKTKINANAVGRHYNSTFGFIGIDSHIFGCLFLLLQKAWIENYSKWLITYDRKYAKNYNQNNEFIYTTSNIAIPTTVLLTAIKEEMEQNF